MKKFTICIATYNQMNYIETSLKSVLLQDYKNIEFIIADDCSKDFDKEKIEKIINKYNNNNFSYKIIHNEENLGIVKNLNNAIDYSTGDYILFFAGDDKLYDEHVVSNFIKSFKENPEASIITSQSFLYDQDMKKINHILVDSLEANKINSLSSRKQYFYMCKECFYASGATAYKREKIIQYNKFSTKYKHVEDWAFWLRLLRNGEKIIYVNFITLCHRDGGISHSKSITPSIYTLEYYKDMKKIYANEILRYFYKLNIFELFQLLKIMLKKYLKINNKNVIDSSKLHSFVVLAYKEEHFLENCIESLLMQTINSEIIISTSTPNDYINSVAKKYNVKLVINKKQTGHINDCKFAYSAASTKYVTLCHQDDIYHKNFAECTLKKILKNKDFIICFSNYYETKNNKLIKNNKLLLVKRLLNFPLLIFKNSKKIRLFLLSLGNAICAPTITYNKEKIFSPIIETNFKSNIDWISYFEFAKMKGKFLYIRRSLLTRRIHENSLTTKVITNKIKNKEDYEIFEKYWGKKMSKIIMKFYVKSEENNKIKK